MKNITAWAIMLVVGFGATSARADLIVGATISAQQVGSNFDYTIVLTNSGASTLNVGTFWFAWIPGQNYLKTPPISANSPTGWNATITHAPTGTDGYAIQWVAGTSTAPNPSLALTPGNSLTFSFRSSDTPADVYGTSVTHPGVSVLTAFVYPGGPFQGTGVRFLVAPVPEPSSIALGAMAALGGAAGLKRRTRRFQRTSA